MNPVAGLSRLVPNGNDNKFAILFDDNDIEREAMKKQSFSTKQPGLSFGGGQGERFVSEKRQRVFKRVEEPLSGSGSLFFVPSSRLPPLQAPAPQPRECGL